MLSVNNVIYTKMWSFFFFFRLKEWGFEKGWGDTAERVRDTMRSLSEVLQAPDPINMEKFFGRLPTVFNIVIFSPHGYFGQSSVLGLPDTGGQVKFYGYKRSYRKLCARRLSTE